MCRRKWDSESSRFQTAFDDVLREIAIMRKLDHENVMTLKDVIDDSASSAPLTRGQSLIGTLSFCNV